MIGVRNASPHGSVPGHRVHTRVDGDDARRNLRVALLGNDQDGVAARDENG